MKIKKIIVVLLLALLVSVGIYFGKQYQFKREQSAQRELILYGNVEIRRVNLGFRVEGRIENIHFEEGDLIPKGTVIATLDRKPYEDDLAVAIAREAQAQARLERLVNGSRPQEIEEARALLDEYKAALELAKADFGRGETLVEQNVISASEFDNETSSQAIAQARVLRATHNLALLEEGSRKEDIAEAREQVAETQASRSRAQTALADTELIAPSDGILLTRVEETGAVVASGKTVLTLSLKDVLWVYVYISESDLGKIEPGMEVEIITDSSPNVYKGQIGYISPEAEFTPKNVETPQIRTDLVYRVRIAANATDRFLRQGMPVTVRIPLQSQTVAEKGKKDT